jgi:hypothetical protein
MIAAKAQMRLGMPTPCKIVTNVTKRLALPSGGKACLDAGIFIFTRPLRKRVGEVSKRL